MCISSRKLRITALGTNPFLREFDNKIEKGLFTSMFCTHCGAEVHDEAVVCMKCGCRIEKPAAQVKTEDDTLSIVIKVFLIIGCISSGWLLLPLAWCIPITVKVFNCLKRGLPISTGIKVCTLLFVSMIAGICLLCRNDK